MRKTDKTIVSVIMAAWAFSCAVTCYSLEIDLIRPNPAGHNELTRTKVVAYSQGYLVNKEKRIKASSDTFGYCTLTGLLSFGATILPQAIKWGGAVTTKTQKFSTVESIGKIEVPVWMPTLAVLATCWGGYKCYTAHKKLKKHRELQKRLTKLSEDTEKETKDISKQGTISTDVINNGPISPSIIGAPSTTSPSEIEKKGKINDDAQDVRPTKQTVIGMLGKHYNRPDTSYKKYDMYTSNDDDKSTTYEVVAVTTHYTDKGKFIGYETQHIFETAPKAVLDRLIQQRKYLDMNRRLNKLPPTSEPINLVVGSAAEKADGQSAESLKTDQDALQEARLKKWQLILVPTDKSPALPGLPPSTSSSLSPSQPNPSVLSWIWGFIKGVWNADPMQ